jgi:hypothetical protein
MQPMLKHSESIDSDFTQPEALLPAQFYGPRRQASDLRPVRRLLIAMLVDAIRCFQTSFGATQSEKRLEFAEARGWIFSDENDGPFSFRTVCEALDLEPKTIRKSLSRWAGERVAGVKPRMIRYSTERARRISV